MLLSELSKLLALNHLETGIASQDFVECVGGSLLSQRVLTLQESLLLAWVEHNQAWQFALLKVEDGGKVWLGADVKAHEHESDTALNLAGEGILDILKSCNNGRIAGCGIRQSVDHAKHAVFLQADVVSTLLADEGNRLREPGAGSSAFDGVFLLGEDKGL